MNKIFSNILKSPILRNIFFICLVIIISIPIYSIFFIYPSFTQFIIKSIEDEALRTGMHLKSIIVPEGKELTRDTLSKDFEKEVQKIKEDFKLEKIKVFSKSGEIIFSSDNKDIGKINKHPYFHEIVAKGNAYSKTILKNTLSLENRLVKSDVIETYVPLMNKDNFVGAIELYYDITAKKEMLGSLVTRSSIILWAIASCLFFAVIIVLFKASKVTIERMQFEEDLRKSRDELEIRVNERTAELFKVNETLRKEINERKQIEKALELSAEQWRTTFDAISQGISLLNREGKILRCNKEMVNILGKPFEEIINGNCWEVIHKTSERIKECPMVRMNQSRCKENSCFELDDRWFEVITDPLLDEEGGLNGAVHIMSDITDRRRLEDKLRQAQKMEAIGTLAGGIAHDFNNILSAIMGYSDLSLEDLPENSPVRAHLKEVFQAGLRARDLVRQILTFSRQTKQEKTPVEVRLIIKEALKLLQSSLPKTIEIQHNIASSSKVFADATQIHQVIMNLCTNAYHAMRDEGGKLEIQLSEVNIDSDSINQHPELNPGKYLRLTISDTGHGMSTSVMERIFEPYFTTKNMEDGTGLGLSVVHGIVKKHDGTITVYSEPGQGTTFQIYLPIYEGAFKEQSSMNEQIAGGQENILFVDDEEQLTRLGQEILERLGYYVTHRTSSVEALEAFRSQPDKFDLVITDLSMPKMTGIELSKEILRIRPGIPIILCTGFSELITMDQAKAIGIKEFVMKPIVKSELATTIRKILDEQNQEQIFSSKYPNSLQT